METMTATGSTNATPEITTTSTATSNAVVETPVKEDLISRVSKVKVDKTPEVNIEEPKFDINDIEKIQDPQAKEQALRAYKSFQRGFNEKYQELAQIRKELDAIKNQAPKPLSIFTTPMPAAQELSIVNKGAKPPKLAP